MNQRREIHTARSRRIELLRGGWGLALLVSPQRVLHATGVRVDARSVLVGRILGARHLTQAVLSGMRPSPEVVAMGVWVDGVHAITALGLALADRERLRPGLLDAAVATVWASAGYRDLVGATAAPPNHQQVRSRLARDVLAIAPGGAQLLRRVAANRRRQESVR